MGATEMASDGSKLIDRGEALMRQAVSDEDCRRAKDECCQRIDWSVTRSALMKDISAQAKILDISKEKHIAERLARVHALKGEIAVLQRELTTIRRNWGIAKGVLRRKRVGLK